MCGWIKLHRAISQSAIADNPDLLALWIHMLISASHSERDQPVGNQIIKLLPGQFVYGRDKFSLKTGLSIAKLRASVLMLEKMKQITIKSTNKFSIISITNWCLYQQDNQQTTNKQPTNNQQTTTDKNVKNLENEKDKPTGKPMVTFSRWLEILKEQGEKPIPEDSSIFEYAQDAGIDPDYLRLVWVEFKARYTDDPKRYKDWRAVFNKTVRGNWYKLWWHDGTGYQLTTLGQQNMAAMKNRDKRDSDEV